MKLFAKALIINRKPTLANFEVFLNELFGTVLWPYRPVFGLQKVSFCVVKGYLLHAKRYPFAFQKVTFRKTGGKKR
jgi:hypothetical protein